MNDWAKNEIELVCKTKDEAEWKNYVDALKVYRRINKTCENEYDKGLMLSTINKLVKGYPLTPITEADEWETDENGIEHCKRLYSLIRTMSDGEYKYSHYGRAYGVDINVQVRYSDNLVTDIANEYFPITLPYVPSATKVEVRTEDFTTSADELYDTIKVISAYNEKLFVPIMRYFKAGENNWIEISEDEWNERKENAYEG